MNQSIAKLTAEHEAKLNAVEAAAREREEARAAVHAQELQQAQDKEKLVRAELAQAQAQLAMWQRRFAIAATALAVAVSVIAFLCFKIFATPILLSVMVVFSILGLVLLFYFFPELLVAIWKFLKWMWKNPISGILVLVILYLLYHFRSKVFKRIFGKTPGGGGGTPSQPQVQLEESLKQIAILRKDLAALKTENEHLKTLLPQVQETGAAAAGQEMFSDSPPSRPGQTFPAHTPIRDISSP